MPTGIAIEEAIEMPTEMALETVTEEVATKTDMLQGVKGAMVKAGAG